MIFFQVSRCSLHIIISGVLTACLLSACGPREGDDLQGKDAGAAEVEISERVIGPLSNDTGKWTNSLPDPRTVTPAHPDRDEKWPEILADYHYAMGTEIWCQPGCRLETNQENGAPIIPEWCTAWGALETSFFVRDGAEDHLSPESGMASYSQNQPARGAPEFVCTRIDLSKVTRTSLAGADGALRKIVILSGKLESDTWRGDKVGMNCKPGCVIPWAAYGYGGETIKEQGEGIRERAARNERRALIPLPNWCSRGTNGCGDSGWEATFSQCTKEKTGVAACTRIVFADMLTGKDEASSELEQASQKPDAP